MKRKAPLALMEQMIMVLVFALAAALCLRAFVLSDRISRESEAQDRAVLLAQNAAEVCKAGGGDLEMHLRVLGGEVDGDSWTAFYDVQLNPVVSAEDAVYQIVVQPETAEVPRMGCAAVTVYDADGAVLFRLPAAWQEVERGG